MKTVWIVTLNVPFGKAVHVFSSYKNALKGACIRMSGSSILGNVPVNKRAEIEKHITDGKYEEAIEMFRDYQDNLAEKISGIRYSIDILMAEIENP